VGFLKILFFNHAQADEVAPAPGTDVVDPEAQAALDAAAQGESIGDDADNVCNPEEENCDVFFEDGQYCNPLFKDCSTIEPA